MGINGCGLFYGGVVFPKDEQCVWVVLEAREQTQGGTCFIHGYGCRACGIHGDGFYAGCCGGTCLSEAVENGGLQPFDVVFGMLSELILTGITIKAIFPAGIIKYGGSYFLAVVGVYDDGPDGISTVVHSYDKLVFSHMAVIPVKITFIFLFLKIYF
jgi:hypothetical protein